MSDYLGEKRLTENLKVLEVLLAVFGNNRNNTALKYIYTANCLKILVNTLYR